MNQLSKKNPISIIAAVGVKFEIGKNNELLWHLPSDFKYFKQQTNGKVIIMGRKTFESIGRPLSDRLNIIVSRSEFKYAGVVATTSLEDAIDRAKEHGGEIMIIGGSTIYNQAINKADRIYLTHVESSFPDADSFFPKMDSTVWKCVSTEQHYADDKNIYNYSFSVYEKVISVSEH
jgi:dihydrofolate reductase